MRNHLLLYTGIPLALYSVFLIVTPHSWYPVTMDPTVVGSSSLAFLVTLFSTHFIFKNRATDPAERAKKESALLLLQNYFLIAFILGLIGTINDFPVTWQIDKVIHFLTGFIGTLALSQFIHGWFGVPLKRAIQLSVLI